MATDPSQLLNGGQLNGVGPKSPAQQLVDAFGRVVPPRDDPAFQPPSDPLKGKDLAADAYVVHRDIPLVTVSTAWAVADVREAFSQLSVGLFDLTSQLIDSLFGDSRVQAAMASRTGGLLGRPMEYVIPRKYADSSIAKECRDAFVDAWPVMAPEPVLSELQSWAVVLGFGPAQLLWETGGKYAIPHPRPWHPRFTYYHWLYRCYVALTLDGPVPIIPGDGHWILHAPHGEYRGWMRGAVRAVAPWWLSRNYALRDWARYSERHGLPIFKALTPAAADPLQIQRFRTEVSRLGVESCVQLPQGVDSSHSYGLEMLEASDGAWQGFSQLIQACDREITLALLAQNLTTEVKEGSYAAARVHGDVRQCLLEADARALAQTIYLQLARPFAAWNFGDADLAPMIKWTVQPFEDNFAASQTFAQWAQGMAALKQAGIVLDDPAKLARDFNINLGIVDVAPNDPPKAAPGAASGEGDSKAEEYEDLSQRVAAFNAAIKGYQDNGFEVDQAFVDALADTIKVPRATLSISPSAPIYGYDIETGVVTIDEARDRKGFKPMAPEQMDQTAPAIAARRAQAAAAAASKPPAGKPKPPAADGAPVQVDKGA